jgi:hypothetical protein
VMVENESTRFKHKSDGRPANCVFVPQPGPSRIAAGQKRLQALQ